MRLQLRIRRLIPFLILFVPLTDAQGQDYAVDRGSLLVGGSGDFSSVGSGGSDDRTTRLVLQPRVQYFVAPGLAMGGQLILSRYSDDNNSSTTVGIGPEVSYYFGAGGRRSAYPFVSASAQLYEGDTDGWGFGGSAGLLYLFTGGVGLQTALYYRETRYDVGETDQFGVSLGLSAFVF